MKTIHSYLCLVTALAVGLLGHAASAQTATWNAVSGNWGNNLNWNPITDPNGVGFHVIFNNGGSLTLDSARTVGTYSQTGGTFTSVVSQSLILDSAGTLNGDGVMNLAHYVYQTGGNVLFTNTDGTIQGYGAIGYNGLSLLNQPAGIISAAVSGKSLSLNGSGTFTNQGLMRAQSGGTLVLDGSSAGSFTNTGTIRSEDGSNVSILFSTLDGGTLDNAGSSGTLTLNFGTLRNVTIAAGSTVTTGLNTDGRLEDTLINHGTLFPSTGEVIFIASDTTLSGGGVVALLDANAKLYNLGNNLTLTNTDNVLRGAGQMGYNSLSVINGPAGIIQADISGQSLRLNGSGTYTNNGLMRAQNGGTLILDGSSAGIFNNNATIRAENGSTVSILFSKVGGTLDNTGSTGVIALNFGTLRDATIVAGSTVTTGLNTDGRLENTLINHGTLFPSTGEVIFIASDTTLSGGGVVALLDTNAKLYNLGGNLTLTNTDNVLRGAGQIGYNSLSVINGTAGIIQADIPGRTLSLNGSGTFTNNGLFAARDGGTLLRASGTFTNFSGSTLTGGAYLAADSTLNLNIGPIVFNAATVTLSGPNSIFTPIDSIRQNDGIFEITEGRNFSVPPLLSRPEQPGPDNGTSNAFTNVGTLVVGPDSSFIVNGDYSQGIDSALDIVLSEANDDPNFHQLNVTGTASLAGKLQVTLANGYTPTPDQTFEIVHAGVIAGNFLEVVGGTVTYTSTGVFINLNPVPALELSGAFSRKVHGVAGTFDLPLVLSPAGNATVEPRANGPTTIVFTFNANVAAADGMISANEFSIVNASFGSASISGDQITLQLSNVVDQSVVRVTLNGIVDLAGAPLIGDNDVEIRALVGDANQDRIVGSPDLQAVKLHRGQTLEQTSGNFLFDLDLDGAISRPDTRVVRANKSHSVP